LNVHAQAPLIEICDVQKGEASPLNEATYPKKRPAQPNTRRTLVRSLQHAIALILSASQGVLDQASNLYESRPDKEWSLTDCTSFVVMKDRGLSEALTADHHFEQAGFVVLFK